MDDLLSIIDILSTALQMRKQLYDEQVEMQCCNLTLVNLHYTFCNFRIRTFLGSWFMQEFNLEVLTFKSHQLDVSLKILNYDWLFLLCLINHFHCRTSRSHSTNDSNSSFLSSSLHMDLVHFYTHQHSYITSITHILNLMLVYRYQSRHRSLLFICMFINIYQFQFGFSLWFHFQKTSCTLMELIQNMVLPYKKLIFQHNTLDMLQCDK